MPKTLLLDANVIVLLVVGLADVEYIARHKRLHPQYGKAQFYRLSEAIKNAPGWATTTHALTEASNLLRQCKDPMRTEIMAALAGIVDTTPELTPKAAQVSDTPEFQRLGLTDAAIISLDREQYQVLTADLDLRLALERKGFEVINFDALLFD